MNHATPQPSQMPAGAFCAATTRPRVGKTICKAIVRECKAVSEAILTSEMVNLNQLEVSRG